MSDQYQTFDQRNAKNPLLEAARPLLRALADLPILLEAERFDGAALKESLEHELGQFSTRCQTSGIQRDHTLVAHYCLCTALDEAISKLFTEWAGQMMLLNSIYKDGNGGEKFFLLMGRMLEKPQEYLPVLELMYYLFGLGYEGQYGLAEGNKHQLTLIRQRLYDLTSGGSKAWPARLSPHGLVETKRPISFFNAIPLWLIAAILSAVLVVFYLFLRYPLSAQQERILNRIDTYLKKEQIQSTLESSIEQILNVSISSQGNTISLLLGVPERTATSARFQLNSHLIFYPGTARVHPQITAVMKHVAQLLANDALWTLTLFVDPISSKPDNLNLAQNRAKSLADFLHSIEPRLSQERVQTITGSYSIKQQSSITLLFKKQNS